MEKAIITKWECPSCGSIIRKSAPLVVTAGKYWFKSPEKCGCGRKGKFRLFTFEPGQTAVISDNDSMIVIPNNKYNQVLNVVKQTLKEEVVNEQDTPEPDDEAEEKE